jgi:hypothetical protein
LPDFRPFPVTETVVSFFKPVAASRQPGCPKKAETVDRLFRFFYWGQPGFVALPPDGGA